MDRGGGGDFSVITAAAPPPVDDSQTAARAVKYGRALRMWLSFSFILGIFFLCFSSCSNAFLAGMVCEVFG